MAGFSVIHRGIREDGDVARSNTVLMPPPSGDHSGLTDGAAFTAALAKLGGAGGTVQFQRGAYFDNTQRSPGNYVVLKGDGGLSAGAVPGTLLAYTGTAASYLNWQTSTGAQVHDMMLFANSAGFTGRLIDLSNFSSLSRVERCTLFLTDTTAAVGVYLDNAEDFTLMGGNVVGGKYGLQGIATAGHIASGISILGPRIGGQGAAGAGVIGIGQGWLVNGIFERQNGQRGIAAGPSPSQGSAIVSCWLGDGTGANPVIEVFADGLDIRGNFIGGTATSKGVQFVGTSDGVDFAANRFDTHALAVDKNAQTVTNIGIGPNSYTNVTTHHNFTAGGTAYIEA